jgi:hypothetical protein
MGKRERDFSGYPIKEHTWNFWKLIFFNNSLLKEKIHSTLGRTHLDFLIPEQLEKSIQSLKRMKVENIGVFHCTGMRAGFRRHEEFRERFFYGYGKCHRRLVRQGAQSAKFLPVAGIQNMEQ